MAKAPRVRTTRPLPFDLLTPEDFERLCLWLVRREGFERVEYLGEAGSDQGRDIVGWREGRHFVFQCKRVNQFGPKAVAKEIEKLAQLPAEEQPDELIFVVTRAMSARARKEARELWGRARCQFWTGAELDERVQRHSDLAAQFFDLRSQSSALGDVLLPGTRKLPERSSPGRLLTAAYEIVPFETSGREADLEVLSRWCESPERRSVFLLTGEGGVGKTRLLIEWCRRLRGRWQTGFLRSDVTSEGLEALLTGADPRLAVVDYAETRLAVVKRILQRMATDPEDEGPILRLMLLARRASDWWESLLRESEIGDLLLNSPEPWNLRGSYRDEKVRATAFVRAGRRLSEMVGESWVEGVACPDLQGSEFERALYVHMAALAAVEGDAIERAQDALRLALEHERHFWHREVEDMGLDAASSEDLKEALSAAVFVLTLTGGAGAEKDAKAIVALAGERWDLSSSHLRVLKRLLRRLYAGDDGRYLDCLTPDLLGEELVAETLQQDASILQALLDAAGTRYGRSILTVLTRLAQRRPEAEAWLRSGVSGRLRILGKAAVDVAVETGDPMGLVIARVLEKEKDVGVAEVLMDRCDEPPLWPSVPLRELAATATEQVLSARHQSWSAPNQDQVNRLARLAGNLGIRLKALGRYEDALDASKQAVDYFRQLTQIQPESFLPYLSRGLNNLGNDLSQLGQLDEALATTEEAVKYDRQLAQARPGAFLPALASSLSNLSLKLRDLDRREAALDATRESLVIRRRLAQAKPDQLDPTLANNLINHGMMLRDLGHREEALDATQEAVDIRRQLAEFRPDAFLPDLVVGLNNLSTMLGDLGRREEALDAVQEAVVHNRQLVNRRPGAFAPDLATSLMNLSIMLGNLGHRQEAVDTAHEAIDLERELARTRPDAYLPRLAAGLGNLGGYLRLVGRREDALDATEEAVAYYRQLVRKQPDAFLPGLASTLGHLGTALSDVGRVKEALDATREAVDYFRRLVQSRPKAFLPDLAGYLSNLGLQLRDSGDCERALRVTQEAVEIKKRLAQDRPEVFLPELASSLGNLGLQLRDAGRAIEAFDATQDAVRTLAQFFLEQPAAFAGWMSIMRRNYLLCAAEADQQPDVVLLESILEAFETLEYRGSRGGA